MRYVLQVLSALVYVVLVFLHKDRQDFWLYFGGVSFLFAFYIYAVVKAKFSFFEILFWAVLFRFLFIFYLPVLSDDVYRFIWDGFLGLTHQNPYLFLPSDYSGEMPTGLFEKLNSPNYYSLYPPLKQYLFQMATALGNGSIYHTIISIRLLLLAAGLVNILLIRLIGIQLNFSENKVAQIVAIYALNPFVIIETVGNLHFEGIMLMFLFLAYYLFLRFENSLLAAVPFAMAVSIKLLPLIFFPIIWKRLGFKAGGYFVLMVSCINFLLFIPFYEEQFLVNIFNSLDLYFHKFEFNASLYYLLRKLGYLVSGFNLIGLIGPLLAALSLSLILKVSFSRLEFAKASLLILLIYVMCSTTVHPWYIITLFGVSLFTEFRFPVIWTFTISLSYFSYSYLPVQENYWLVTLEYLAVLVAVYWETKNKSSLI